MSVIIPVYNDAERLERCLDALAEQTLPAGGFEAIVVDNGSEAPPRELVERYPFCRFAEEPQPGSYAARNRGIGLAGAEVFAFTDSDCLPEPDWLGRGLAALEGAIGPVVIGGRVEVFASDPRRPTAVELVDIAFGLNQVDNIHANHFSVTANLLAPRAAFDAAGPFDATLLSAGDHEWCLRAGEAGYTMRYAEDVCVRHPARADFAALTKQARRIVGGKMDRRGSGGAGGALTRHFWWTVGRVFLPNLSKIARARRRLAARGYGWLAWLKTIPVILAVQYVMALEFVRKRLGGRSERL